MVTTQRGAPRRYERRERDHRPSPRGQHALGVRRSQGKVEGMRESDVVADKYGIYGTRCLNVDTVDSIQSASVNK